jgi:hypothetical protein
MHELSSAERNARYRRFFELLNNPPGLYPVILNFLSVSYRKICSVMRQLHNRKVSEKHVLIMVNCCSLKRSIFNKRNNCTFMFDVIVISSQVLFHNGSLLHSQFNTQLLITVHNSSRNLTHV